MYVEQSMHLYSINSQPLWAQTSLDADGLCFSLIKIFVRRRVGRDTCRHYAADEYSPDMSLWGAQYSLQCE